MGHGAASGHSLNSRQCILVLLTSATIPAGTAILYNLVHCNCFVSFLDDLYSFQGFFLHISGIVEQVLAAKMQAAEEEFVDKRFWTIKETGFRGPDDQCKLFKYWWVLIKLSPRVRMLTKVCSQITVLRIMGNILKRAR